MTLQEERLKVLEMVRQGKISPEEASMLLEALEGATPTPEEPSEGKPTSKAKKGRMFRVKVSDTRSGKTRVDIRLPVGLVSAGIKTGAKFSPEIEGVNIDELMAYIESGEVGKFVDVYGDEDDEHVEVWIE